MAAMSVALLLPTTGLASEVPLNEPIEVGTLDASGAGTAHGADVALSGDLAVVGRPGDGTVDVFRRTPTEPTLEHLPWQWSWHCSLQPPHPESDTEFGSSVAIDGQTVVVGAWGDDTIATNAGAVWVFDVPLEFESPPADPLEPASLLLAEPPTESDYFGWDVAIRGDTVAVGGWGDDEDGDHAGAVHVFERSQDGFSLVTKLTPGVESEGGRFGATVALAGDLLLIGAPARAGWSGSVYLYVSGLDAWSPLQRLDSPEGDVWERFGHAIATVVEADGDVTGILVGAPGDGELGPQAGCAFLFAPVEGAESLDFQPHEIPKLVAPGGGPLEQAGSSLAAFVEEDSAGSGDGGGILIGAPGWRHPDDDVPHGAVYFVDFDELEGGGVDSGRVVLPSNPGDGLGARIAAEFSPVSGSGGFSAFTVIAGAPAADVGLGKAHLVNGPAGMPGGGDCDSNGLLDAMEMVFYPEIADCDGDGTPDACQLEPSNDCDGDGVLDVCQLDPATDCDGDGMLDSCQLNPMTDCDGDDTLDVCQLDPATDCDGDGMLDSCQLNPMTDCDGDGMLDVCQLDPATDCDGDGMLDSCQLDPATDCDGDGMLDVCQLNPMTDCDGDGMLDVCQLDPSTDCDGNGVLDACEGGGPGDCNADGIPDVCQLGPESDCNGDGVLDACQPGLLEDCDSDGVPDACQLDATTDCNADAVLDVCQLDAITDCDSNGLLDVCEIAMDPGADCDGDGILDACQVPEGDPISAEWLTEQFVSGVDLAGLGIRLNPTGNSVPPYYQLCTVAASDVWLDPVSHAPLTLTDDDSMLVTLPFSFDYAGALWPELFVASNGNVTFGKSDTTYIETLVDHFMMKRLSVLFDDLDPEAGGTVLVGQGPAGSFVVTWLDLPEYQVPNTSNTAQLVLHPDGAIEMSWINLTSTTAISGVSMGTGMGPGFVMTDLSNAWDCQVRMPAPDGDCDGSGVQDACEAVPVGDPWWGTEHFAGDFDLRYTMVTFIPESPPSPNAWRVCSAPIAAFPVDPMEGGTVVTMMDDDSYMVPIGAAFPFAGTTWNDAFINSNGSITFSYGDYGWDSTLESHFLYPRVSGLLTDLNPEVAGEVRYQYGMDGGLAVTWLGVAVYGWVEYSVDMQILLHPDGVVDVAFLGADPFDAVVGVSEGSGLPQSFAQTDLSASGATCDLLQPFDDCDGSGVMDAIEIALGCLGDFNTNGIPDICEGGGLAGMAPRCPWDVTGDADVNVHDLLALLEHWGEAKFASPSARFDLAPPKGDRSVDAADLIEMIHGMQQGCGQP